MFKTFRCLGIVGNFDRSRVILTIFPLAHIELLLQILLIY